MLQTKETQFQEKNLLTHQSKNADGETVYLSRWKAFVDESAARLKETQFHEPYSR